MAIVVSSVLVFIFSSLQLSVVSRLPLENGMADIVLLLIIVWCLNPQAKKFYIPTLLAGGIISFISSVPIHAIFISYLLAAIITRLLIARLWEMPLFSMLISTIIATVAQHVIYIIALQFQGSSIPFMQGLREITLPSIFINIIFAFPIYLLVRDVQKFVYKELENE